MLHVVPSAPRGIDDEAKDNAAPDKMAQGAAGEAQSEATPTVLKRVMQEQRVRATPMRITQEEAFAHAIHMSLKAEGRALDARVRRRGPRPVGSSPLKQMWIAPSPASEQQASEDIPSMETKVDDEFSRGSITLRRSPPLSVWQMTLPLRAASAPAEREVRMHAPLPVRPTPQNQNRPASQQASPRPLLVTNSTEFKFPSQLALPLPPRAPAGAMKPLGSRSRPVRVRRPSRERPPVKSCIEQEKIAKIGCLSPRRTREPFGTIRHHVSTELLDVALTTSCILPSVASGA